MNRPMKMRSGAVIQAGLNARPKHTLPPMVMPTTGIYRAIVINTFTTDDETSLRGIGVECDVVLVRSLTRLARVPVKQLNHGRNNAWAPWIPRQSTRTISTGAAVNLTTRSDRGVFTGDASLLSDLDGDLVIVEFLEHDPDRPIITGALSHDQNLRRVAGAQTAAPTERVGWLEGTYRQGSPRRDELYFSQAGSEVRVNGQGDVLVSTEGATDDPTTETPSTNTGQVRIRVKDASPTSPRFTVAIGNTDVLEVYKDATGVHVDIGEGATEHIVLGDAFKTLFNTHTHSSPLGGNTGVPNQQMDLVPGTHLSQQHRVR